MAASYKGYMHDLFRLLVCNAMENPKTKLIFV